MIMNILFLTIGRLESIEAHAIYSDLLRCFRDHGHSVFAISPYEKRSGKETELVHEDGAAILHLKTGNVTGDTGLIEKGLAQLSLESMYIHAIKKYFSDVKFDLVMYSTPPITFYRAVRYVKKRDGAKSYLLLKDIFPQNAVDMGMMSKHGVKGILYHYFRNKEINLYRVSDKIGCMSPANKEYLLHHNQNLHPDKIDICPNAVEVLDHHVDLEKRTALRTKYGIPQDKTVFVYGGNLGKPQGIPFLVECLKNNSNQQAFFVIIGDGSECHVLEDFIRDEKPENVLLIKRLPKDDYDSMVGCCDIGLIFLDHRFTIPNFPSRLLAYMQAKLPVLAVTDVSTDIGKIITDAGFGWWSESNRVSDFNEVVDKIIQTDRTKLAEREFQYLLENYSVERVYDTIIGSVSALL